MRVYIILSVLFAMLIGTGLAQNAITGDVNAFKQALEKDGFTVQKGGLGFLDTIKLHDLGVLPSCYGNNPSTKYLSCFVPPAPGSKVPGLFSKIARTLGLSTNLSSFWNLGPDEAVVFVGRTPPECRYFSYDHYIVDRTYGNETRWIFANIADTVNNLIINTEGTPNGLAGNPFNRLEQLREAILHKYSGLNATELPTSIAFPVGIDAIQRGIDALIPDNDACYLWTVNQAVFSPTPSFPNLSLYYPFVRNPPVTLGNDTNDFIIVYGVNHVATGKATYSNFAVYGADIWNGAGAITDQDFNGTAEAYLPGDPNAKYLYVYKIARHANGDPHCFEVPYGPGSYGIHPNQPIYILWRNYMEKATKTGPSYSEILYDHAIKFSPKK